ncbi:hypothetical protein [Photobacterium sp. GB-72]|nr:hypothetical protein [Photobacterium sp. GB-72]
MSRVVVGRPTIYPQSPKIGKNPEKVILVRGKNRELENHVSYNRS